MTVKELMNELNKYPQDSDINISSPYAYPYALISDLKVEYSSLVSDENGIHRVGNNISNPNDVPLKFQTSRKVHIFVK